MLGRLLASFAKADAENVFAPPDGTRVYAIGDIHGRIDLLKTLHGKIAADIEQAEADRAVVVYLGDYIDRGSSSREVIDLLLDAPIQSADAIHLRGNHEDIMLRYLEEPDIGPKWFINGGDTTLTSYGVPLAYDDSSEAELARTRDSLADALPQSHLDFLRALKSYHVEGGYLFVHAGIRPGVAVEEQSDRDLMWIRHEFLNSRADHGYRVVHGHSISSQPEVRVNRIGIDTGAFFSDRLTCVVLDRETVGWLHTAGVA